MTRISKKELVALETQVDGHEVCRSIVVGGGLWEAQQAAEIACTEMHTTQLQEASETTVHATLERF
jgi:hypothetical protein